MYRKFFKRFFDLVLVIVFFLLFWWLFLIVGYLVKKKLGSPVIFKQERPGKDEKIFLMYKFRSMTDEKDKNGNLLPDKDRLPKFGKLLRSTSLDELPELWNVFKGEMSLVGPRPLLKKYQEYYTKEELKRFEARPGITGLAQISGRNIISWSERFKYDIEYVENISFLGDILIILKTIFKVIKSEDIIVDANSIMKNLDEERRDFKKENDIKRL